MTRLRIDRGVRLWELWLVENSPLPGGRMVIYKNQCAVEMIIMLYLVYLSGARS